MLLAPLVFCQIRRHLVENNFDRLIILMLWVKRSINYLRSSGINGGMKWLRIGLGFTKMGFESAGVISLHRKGMGLQMVWWKWVLWCLFPYQPTGLMFGLIYYRMKTVMPGAIFHTYTTLWAFRFCRCSKFRIFPS